MAKLVSLKAADLRRELEERDLDTTGNKTVLQNRLRLALEEEGIDPETFLFETDSGRLLSSLSSLENNLHSKLEENKSSLESKLEENKSSLESKLEENKSALSALEGKMEANTSSLENKLEEKFETLQENTKILREELKAVDKKVNELEVEFEKKVDKIEERLKHLESGTTVTTFKEVSSPAHQEKRKNTTGEDYKGPIILPGQHSGLPTFDGKMPWEDFLSLFETAAVIHGWTPAAKAAMLSLSLRGDALAVLQTVPMADRQNIDELLRRLEMRFGHRHMEQLYRSQLKNRIQKANESLQEFETDIARLVRNAYPSVEDDVYESLAVEKFLDGLREPETQQAIKLARPQTLSEALTQALEFEAVRQSVRSHARVRAVEAEDRSESSLEEMVKRILEKLKVGKREVRCWGCGERGHLRNKCQKKTAERKEQEN